MNYFRCFLLVTLFVFSSVCLLPASGLPVRSEYPDQKDYEKDKAADYSAIDRHAVSVPESREDSIENLTRYLLSKAGNDREKARAIYRWITEHVSYDVEKFFSGSYKKTGNLSAEEVLKVRKAVCGGYAALFQKMARTGGLECELISGYSKISDEKLASRLGSDMIGHAWNAVRIDGKWRFIESTWGAGNIRSDTKKFEKRFKEFFFLTPADILLRSHFPEEPEWQLVPGKIDESRYKSLVSPYAEYYNAGFTLKDLPRDVLEVKCEDRIEFFLPRKKDFKVIAQVKRGEKEIPDRAFVQTLQDKYRIIAYFPVKGKYKVSIFGKKASQEGLFPMLLQYRVTSNSGIATDKMELECPVEPSEKFFEYGFSADKLKYGNLRIKSDGKVSITLIGKAGLTLMTELKRNNKKLESRAFVENNGNSYTVTVLPDGKGLFVLDIYGKPAGQEGKYPHLIKYHIEASDGIKLEEAETLAPVIPFQQFEELGCSLDRLSHKSARIKCGEKLKLVLESTKPLELMAVLDKHNQEIKNSTFVKSSKNKHFIYSVFSSEGDYEITIFGRIKGETGKYAGLVKYNITASGFNSEKRGYPVCYSGYAEKGAILYSPMEGYLKIDTEYSFKVKIPGATKAAVVCGDAWTTLESASGDVFQGKVKISAVKIGVYALFGESENYTGLLTYTGVR